MARNTYNETFKAEACRLVTEQKYAKSEVCRKLGVSYQALDDWLRKLPDSPEAMKLRILQRRL